MSVPLVRFVIGGVQKSGTTALAKMLARHPQIVLPRGKEAHMFDAPDFDERWTPEQVDARFAREFDAAPHDALHGDATPIYCFHPVFIRRIAAYNPAMRWVLLLRHPVERAVSHYWMERGRGNETWPFWPAMLLERRRLAGHADDFSHASPLRHHSYRARGDYARQLDDLLAHFPREQVLLLRNEALAEAPADILRQVSAFLGSPEAKWGHVAESDRVFAGDYVRLRRGGLRYRMMSCLMAREMRCARDRYGVEWR